jgi:rod shape-determining protein MreB and related proteins
MFSAVLGLFSQDLAVDLGTSRTQVHLRNSGVICDQPTVVSVATGRKGRREVIAIGDEAQSMLGRAPADIEVIRPILNGRIQDFEVAEAFLLHLVRQIHGRNSLMRPRMVVTVPHAASDMEIRAIRDNCASAGAREVNLLMRPVAAGLGAGLPIDAPEGYLVVDVGGGATEISVLALSGVVSCTSIVGGVGIDEAIISWMKREHALLIGQPTAEQIKIDACDTVAKGRCLRTGVPRGVPVRKADILHAFEGELDKIGAAVAAALAEAPPELASDIVDTGVILTGGGSQLIGLHDAVGQATGLPIIPADTPQMAVIHGAGRVLQEYDLRPALAS